MNRLEQTIKLAQENAWKENNQDNWCFPPYLGTFFLSEYYFEILALNYTQVTQFNQTYFTELLLSTQLPDGSWKQILEPNIPSGGLDPTIFNYWFLKSIGINTERDEMKKSAQWVRDHGGIEAAQTMSKYKLAIFGHYPWEDLFYVPLFIFKDEGLFHFTYAKNIVSQWVYPHLTALAYLRYQRTVFKHGADIHELWLNPDKIKQIQIDQRETTAQPDESLHNLIKEILNLRRPFGSFGAYTISTLLNLLALEDFNSRWPNLFTEEIIEAKQKGFTYVEFNYFNSLVPYQGSLDDGRWWDTILMSWALLESNEDPKKLEKSIDKMISEGVQKNGGIAYGYDFEYAPDADDTGLLLLVLQMQSQTINNTNKYYEQIKLNQDWLQSMQNDDGGFPAFDKGKTGNNIIFKFAFDFYGIANSAEIFDPSSPDVTAHILEGFASTGLKDLDHPVIAKAIQYLKNSQNSLGAWQARWGINYIYSVGCIIPALSKLGYNLKENWIQKSINWLTSKQNLDGGFGESTLSYNFPEQWNGRGVSTNTQTSWALIALIEVRNIYNVQDSIEKAVNYLLNSFENNNNQFYDVSVIGTGHRGLLYLQYPVYAYSFPLLSLARFKNYLKQDTIDKYNLNKQNIDNNVPPKLEF